jgi:hypothetical protein
MMVRIAVTAADEPHVVREFNPIARIIIGGSGS